VKCESSLSVLRNNAAFDASLVKCLVTGHDFSRAERDAKRIGALAPEEATSGGLKPGRVIGRENLFGTAEAVPCYKACRRKSFRRL